MGAEELVTHELCLEYRKPIRIGKATLHLRNLWHDCAELAIDAPLDISIKREELITGQRRPSYLGRSRRPYSTVRLQKKTSKALRLRALIDMPYYGVIEGAHLVLVYKHNFYWAVSSAGRVPWLYWSSAEIFEEIKRGMWEVAHA